MLILLWRRIARAIEWVLSTRAYMRIEGFVLVAWRGNW